MINNPDLKNAVQFMTSFVRLTSLFLFTFVSISFPVYSAKSEDVNIGVLSFRSKEQTLQKWQETANYLSDSIPGYHFNIIPMFYSELEQATKQGDIDFVLTNSGHYITLNVNHGVIRLVTLVKKVHNNAIDKFGGVLFTHSDRADINSLKDLKGKSFLGVGKSSLGGFLVAWEELLKADIDPFKDFENLSFNGMPHDDVVMKVINQEVDAGTVRTSILENMANEGRINLKQVKILGSKQDLDFPFIHSTNLYPEWPFSIVKGTSSQLSKKVLVALLDITSDDKAAINGKYLQWLPPADYLPVRNLMENLRTGPFKQPQRFNANDVIGKYSTILLIMACIIFIVILFVVLWLSKLNRALKRTKNKLEVLVDKQSEDLTLSQKALLDSEFKYRTLFDKSADAFLLIEGEKFIDCNTATVEMLGYKDKQELFNTHPSELSPPKQPDGRDSFEKANDMIAIAFKNGSHRFEWDHKRQNGEVFPVEVLLTVVPFGNNELLHVVWRDITERKKSENAIKISEIKFRGLIESAPDGMVVVNEKGEIELINQQLENITGYTATELIGNKIEKLIPERYKSHVQLRNKYLENPRARSMGESSELFLQRKNGTEFPVEISLSPLKTNEGTIITASIRDITERKQVEKKLNFQASHDALTGLINRQEFERRAERLLVTNREKNEEHALCYLDLDQFKVVNDTCGHIAGDELLRQLSIVIQHEVRKRDTLARLGGDEFAVLMEHCSLEQAYRVASSLLKAIQDYQFSWQRKSFRVSASIGLVAISETTQSLTELLSKVDAACYMAKDKGRNRIHIHHEEDSEAAQRHGEMQWVTRIQQALENDSFCLYAQSIVPLDARKGIHYELLIRMKGKGGEIIPPGAFMPAAERYSLISNLDSWVIRNAFNLFSNNPDFMNQVDFISINLSGASFSDESFLKFVIEQLKESSVDGRKLCFEITETAAISNLREADKFIAELRQYGCRFALDDFGSGLSSFAYLKNLSVDFLKIDGLFIKDMMDDPIDHAMVKSINEIGRVMSMETIAEYVENEMIKGMLKEIGVNFAQGYSIHKPQPFDELLERPNNVIDINKLDSH